MKKYQITYVQEFDGKKLSDSYIKYADSIDQLHLATKALLDDPHVYYVEFEEIQEETK